MAARHLGQFTSHQSAISNLIQRIMRENHSITWFPRPKPELIFCRQEFDFDWRCVFQSVVELLCETRSSNLLGSRGFRNHGLQSLLQDQISKSIE